MAEGVELRARAKQWYLENPLATIRDVSEQFGAPYETVRDWAKAEAWYSARVLQGDMSDEQAALQAAGMRTIIFNTVASGEVPSSDLPNLVKAWMSLRGVREPQEAEETFDRDSLLADS